MSLLDGLIGAWGAQFIAHWFDFHLFIFNHAVCVSPAKLDHSYWSWPKLTTQALPYRQGDANCTINLGFLLLIHRFHLFAIYRG